MTSPPPYDDFVFRDSVSRETFDKLLLYHDLLLKWQTKLNLISPQTIGNLWERHFLDSIQIFSLISRNSPVIFDLGSGAGFPGLIISLILNCPVMLIESDKKKSIFLSEVIRQTNSSAIVITSRIESFFPKEKADVIISRACAPLLKLLNYSKPLLKPDGNCIFLKGKSWKEELDVASERCMFHVEHFSSLTDPSGRILRLSQINYI